MKTKCVQILFSFVCLLGAATLQEMLPSFGGVKMPFLLALTLLTAFSEEAPLMRTHELSDKPLHNMRWIFVALLAGSFEDALSLFPTLCAAGFFLLAASLVRLVRPFVQKLSSASLALVTFLLAAPCHELWLSLWGVGGSDGTLFVRFFASAVTALPAGLLVFLFVPPLKEAIGFDGSPLEGGDA